jgi:hypothetical protein
MALRLGLGCSKLIKSNRAADVCVQMTVVLGSDRQQMVLCSQFLGISSQVCGVKH